MSGLRHHCQYLCPQPNMMANLLLMAARAMLHRHIIYNKTLDELEALERLGQAFLVYLETMPVSNREVDFEKLSQSYQRGYAQGKRDLPEWKRFLGMAK